MNYVIYEDDYTIIWYCGIDGELHVNKRTVTFEEFIRAIDTIPDKSPEWKREMIEIWAEFYGFKGVA